MKTHYPFVSSYFTSIHHAFPPAYFNQTDAERSYRVLHYQQRQLGPLYLTYVVVREESVLERFERQCQDFYEKHLQVTDTLRPLLKRRMESKHA